MADFDLDVSGLQDVAESINDLEGQWSDAPTYQVGTDAEYAVSLEFGCGPIRADDGYLRFEVDGETIFRKEVSGHPPYPFFRPALREFEANPKSFIIDNTGWNSIREIPNVNQLVRAAAVALETQITNNASAQSGNDRSPGTHPNHPKRDTGNLAASISFTRVG